MAPVVLELKQESWAKVTVLVTAQHRQMLDQVLSTFAISADIDLDVMEQGQDLPTLTSKLISKLDKIIKKDAFDMVLGQGDTTTLFTTALTSFYAGIPFGHVEAGLRTHDPINPFPEEMDRLLTCQLASLHFAPTEEDKHNLLLEGVPENHIFITGNTSIDALLSICHKDPPQHSFNHTKKRLIFTTIHRRESFGASFLGICQAFRQIAQNIENIEILYPVHPNPRIHDVAWKELGNCENVTLCEPLDYVSCVAAMKKSYLILTDSGGIQEEAPILGKPVLVVRDKTERYEGIKAGVTKLVGTTPETIFQEVQKLCTQPALYEKMSQKLFLYGDGTAARQIVQILKDYLDIKKVH